MEDDKDDQIGLSIVEPDEVKGPAVSSMEFDEVAEDPTGFQFVLTANQFAITELRFSTNLMMLTQVMVGAMEVISEAMGVPLTDFASHLHATAQNVQAAKLNS